MKKPEKLIKADKQATIEVKQKRVVT